jgi:putative transcriptional regulator
VSIGAHLSAVHPPRPRKESSFWGGGVLEGKLYLCVIIDDVMYKTIEIDRKRLTMMGVSFPDIETLNSAAGAIGSNMYEGFEPTERLIRLYLDVKMGKIDEACFLTELKAAI